ncbi:Hsp20/alpha crystallin family protein [Candidatus Aerophobetes bacterium]|nr:Hsp20/alpha crystallin family protein [Candidatus Aerophobetes bacterium]
MAIWDPWREFSQIEREMRKMFDELWGARGRIGERLALPGRAGGVPMEREEMMTRTPLLDLIDKKDALVLRSDMPGVKKENLKITVTDDEVSLSGKVERAKEDKKEDYYYSERAYSSWQRTIPLPVKIQSDKAKATYKDGMLEITLPKSEEAKEKRKELKID